jgi:RNA polymerase sigma factor (sigma-70 family)
MPGRSSGADTLKHLQALFREGTFSGLTDGELMQRCTSAGDDSAAAAFTALVGRHGPMVFRVCYQVLGDSHDAEDAFQATFLVLARKARSVRNYDSVASWLYGVADRVARRARAEAARRRVHEQPCSELTALESVGEQTGSETWPELHEEVASLPEKLRVPIVLCYLEGLTAEAAAQRLGCPRGTVLSRLSRARERLRERLARRGVVLSTGLPLLATNSAVPDGLSHATVQAAIRITAGKTAAGTVPASVAALTEGVLRMMSRVRLIRVVGAILAIGAMSIGVGVVVSQTVGSPPRVAQASRAGEKTEPRVSSRDDPSRKAKEQAGELIVRAADLSRRGEDDGLTGMVAIDPETAEWRTIYKGLSLPPGPVSPDGRYIVYSSLGADPDADQVGIWVYDMKGETTPRRIFERRGQPFWTNHGRQIVIGSPGGGKFETWRVNADGTGRTKLPIPETDLVLDCSSDGTWLATRTESAEGTHRGQLTMIHSDGSGARDLTEGSATQDLFSVCKISPDGGSIAYSTLAILPGFRRVSPPNSAPTARTTNPGCVQ